MKNNQPFFNKYYDYTVARRRFFSFVCSRSLNAVFAKLQFFSILYSGAKA